MKAEPYTIAISQERLDDLRRRLLATSWPGDFGNEQWHYGVEENWLKGMVAYWAQDFDWRAQEADMNRFAHYKVMIDDVPIHFIHHRSGRPGAIPLLLTHGWPWTFWDWRDLIEPLAQGTPAFDVVVPSLPGFAFSSPLRTTGIGARRIAQLWVRLMRDVLGYDRFAAAGGDWGSLITAELGHAHAAHLLGIHMTLPAVPGNEPVGLTPESFSGDEAWMAARNAEAFPTITSHVAVQSSDPQTLAYALADSPVGTAAWIWERRRAWSDCGGDIAGYMGRDFLCTIASLFWLTNSIGSSLRIYKEHFAGAGMAMNWPLLHDRIPVVEAPAGMTVAPKEVVLLPRAIVERVVNLKRWTVLPRGGHFLPSEAPDLLVAEYRAFFANPTG